MSHDPSTTPRNSLGTAGFVLGLVGLVFSFIPLVGVTAWPLVIIGLTLSAVGIAKARKTKAPKGLAIAGTILSAIGLLICITWVGVVGKVVDEAERNELKPVEAGQAPTDDQHIVVFELSTDQAVNVRYGDLGDQRTVVVDPTDDWRQEFSFGGGLHHLTLSATPVDNSDLDSTVTCSITVDGETVAQQSNPFGVWCSAEVDK
ncbi:MULTISPECIES: DUF4190 domain-containing protein [Saccharomonospora]|jgi:hypothetical protein|uniref:DUF4190 domain-containing protein n=1 Tax=Saccharomonospora TaxID=1851 RepID=UPI0024A9B82F|nr:MULTISPECIES: DUF4190 domain-containing protein [Saccharomonospora]